MVVSGSKPVGDESLLCVKIASRGDLLLAGPAFATLRRERPRSYIVLTVGESCEDVARRLPFFDEVRTIDDRALFAGTGNERVRTAVRLFRAMRGQDAKSDGGNRRRFSEVFIFHRDWRYGLLAWLARIPIRRGLVRHRGGFLTAPYTPSAQEHDVVQYLQMVRGMRGASAEADEPAGISAPSLEGVWRFLPGERDAGLAAAERLGFNPARPCAALGFGGGHNVKTRTSLKAWPLSRFRELADRLADQGCDVVWLGDTEDARILGTAPRGLNLAGKLSVPESAAVLSACVVSVANDSLLLHLSEAVGTPSVGLFGPTDPAQYGPRGPRSAAVWIGESLACSPCYRDGFFPPCRFAHRCMHDLRVETVLEKVQPLIAAADSRAAQKVASRAE